MNDVEVDTKVITEWQHPDSSFNLIISCLHLHSVNNIESYLRSLLSSLSSDGCLIATTLGSQTLEQLRISFVLAENQRYGGVSPHVSPFIALSQIGNLLHRTGYRITTISRNKCIYINYLGEYFVENPWELMTWIRIVGENSCLLGRRKGVYKDLFTAMVAIYSSIFNGEGKERGEGNQQKIQVTTDIISFIGWKYAENQIGPAKRGSQNITFQDWVKELQKIEGGKLKYGQINEEGDGEIKKPSADKPTNIPPNTQNK